MSAAAGNAASKDAGNAAAPNYTDFFSTIAPQTKIYIKCDATLSKDLYDIYGKVIPDRERLKESCKSNVLAETDFMSYDNTTKEVRLLIRRILFVDCLPDMWVNAGEFGMPVTVGTADTSFYKNYQHSSRFYPRKGIVKPVGGARHRRSTRRRRSLRRRKSQRHH